MTEIGAWRRDPRVSAERTHETWLDIRLIVRLFRHSPFLLPVNVDDEQSELKRGKRSQVWRRTSARERAYTLSNCTLPLARN